MSKTKKTNENIDWDAVEKWELILRTCPAMRTQAKQKLTELMSDP